MGTNETSAALGNIGGKHFSRKYFSRGEKNEHGSQIGGHGAIIKFQWLKWPMEKEKLPSGGW